MTHRHGAGILILIAPAMCNCTALPIDLNLDNGIEGIVIAGPQCMTMLRRRLPTIRPPLTLAELPETTRIYSAQA